MHYTNAFMLESLRIVSFAFFSVPHSATSDITVGDYVIPKGTGIFPSLISDMYDPEHFPNPHEHVYDKTAPTKSVYIRRSMLLIAYNN